MRVSGCVISLDEEDRIARCLESLSWCDELVVLDSGSQDATCKIAAEYGARVEHQDFLGHRRQKQRCVELASNDWIVSLDCDEWLSADLQSELRAAFDELGRADAPDAAGPAGREGDAGDRSAASRASNDRVVGFSMPRRNVYLGRAMRHGQFWPDRKLRAFDRRCARWGGTDPHDRVELTGPGRVVELANPIEHVSYRDFAEHSATVERFARIAARAMHEEGRRAGVLSPLTRASGALFKNLVLKLGVLDGWRGFVASWMAARYDWRKYAELRRLVSTKAAHEGAG